MKNKVAKGTVYLMIAQLTVIISGYLIHIGLARFLGPATYGDFGFILSLALITKMVFIIGMNPAVSKYISEQKEKAREIYHQGMKIQLFFIIICVLFYFFFSGFIAQLFHDSALKEIIFLSSFVTLTFGLYAIATKGFLNGIRLFRHQAIAEMIHSLLKVVLVFIFVYLGFGILGAIFAYVLAPLVAFVFASIIIKRHLSKKRISKDISNNHDLSKFQKNESKTINSFDKWTLIKFSLPITFFYLLITLTTEMGILSVKSILMSNTLTGFYTSAVTLSRVTYSLFAALPMTMLPSISAAFAKRDFSLIKKYINQSMRYSMIILFPLTIVISTNAKQIISLIYSSQFIEAAASLSILVFGFTFLVIFMTQCSFLQGINKPNLAMLFAFLAAGLAWLLNITLIPKYGMFGAAIAMTLTALLSLIIISVYVYHKFKTLINFGSFLNITIASLIIYLVSLYWKLPGNYFMVSIFLLLILYLLLLVAFGEIKEEDKQLFFSILRVNRK
jgi:stage V sporulation protein B